MNLFSNNNLTRLLRVKPDKPQQKLSASPSSSVEVEDQKISQDFYGQQKKDEAVTTTKEVKGVKVMDFDTSIDVLYKSFRTWHRLQHNGIVKTQHYEDMRYSEDWEERHPERFEMIHYGSKCRDSIVIGHGKYSRVYKRGGFAYKTIKTGYLREKEDIGKLRCNLKELMFFHSLDHPRIMKCCRSQLLMEHGLFKKIIHEMPNARCTLSQLIYAHEINCFSDFVYLMRGVAEALQYMHQYRIVHGDVKPSNILVHKSQVFLSDFTLTTFEEKGQEIAFGTLYWRAPECLMMQECRTPADVWSFAMILLDALYGCNYGQDVLQAQDNTDLLAKLVYIVDQPPVNWVKKYLPDAKQQADVLYRSFPELQIRLQKTMVQLPLSDPELELVKDLLSHVLQWEPENRWTMDQVLQHPLFRDVPSSIPKVSANTWILAEKHCHIQWRAQAEKDFVTKWVKYYYYETFHVNLTSQLDWLLHDTIILAKRLLDRLKNLETTFNVKSVIKKSCQFCYFIWQDYWPGNEDPTFECVLFHILYLLDYVIFPLNLQETIIEPVNLNISDLSSEKVATQTPSKISTNNDANNDTNHQLTNEVVYLTTNNTNTSSDNNHTYSDNTSGISFVFENGTSLLTVRE